MRTSRVSKDTTKLVDVLNSAPRRQSRRIASSNPLSSYAVTDKRNSFAKDESQANERDDSSGLSSANTTDIEDLLTPATPQKRKRKRGQDSPKTKRTITSTARTTSSSRLSTTPQKPVTVRDEETRRNTKNKPRRLPARKSKAADGTVIKVEPPSNWEKIYDTVKEMRRKNPTAPVDTMGCSQLYWRSSSPRERRLHILIALMLSSQTKDTVTALAMQRLHTELAPENEHVDPEAIKKEDDEKIQIKAEDEISKTKKVLTWDHTKQQTKSTLTLDNLLAVSPTRLNQLIQTVGFHNNKTKYIKAAAVMLRDEFDSDIPPTVEGLIRLPGVGPKMAYLCMSSAWGRDEGIGVDVHVHRITNLWGWHKTKTPEETRAALESWLPRDKWHEINKLLVGLGQTVCLPVARRCGECELAGSGLCMSEIKGWAAKGKGRVKKVEEMEEVKEESKIEVKVEEEG
ncbi:hypothetical protein AJ79_05851 [Helicocarpus griseus UAMH5409]|uniref:Endonuclease III homolog n=1 Tax=Helicocarpus griseus UAMH5409 TaxID=1447875 RepID=A0A2B7XJP1_9EURO|nr:hypothetical protein AJ79_05851 [Helicocarpus griseus UAMH5409]